jgi:hypothetical protein
MILGPVTSIILGIFLSITIAKPLDKSLKGVINMIVSSASEIAATVEQQERIINQQVTVVNETLPQWMNWDHHRVKQQSRRDLHLTVPVRC